jgi:fructokinase
MDQSKSLTVVGLGEALFDCFSPQRIVLGGAPVNLAVHAHQLLQSRGQGVVASSVGKDQLGSQLLAELSQRRMITDYITISSKYPTSTVEVAVNPGGETQYEITQGVAWDHLEFSEPLAKLAETCSAVCFGTLAQRSEQSRETIRRYLDIAKSALKVCDINLRQRFYSAEIIRESLAAADVLKLNDIELPTVRELLGRQTDTSIDEQASDLLQQFELRLLALTRGESGTVLFTADERVEGSVPTYPPQENADAVGAGDSCCAAIIVGLLLGKSLPEIVILANRVGAFVASQAGATPVLPKEILERV